MKSLKNLLKNLILAAVVLVGISAFAEGTINDLPNPIWVCKEANVADGHLEVTVAKDQFGQLSAQFIVRDQFNGDQLLAEFLEVEFTDEGADTFVPREKYSYSNPLKRLESFELTVNIMNENEASGSATLSRGRVSQTFDVTCKTK